MRHRHAISDDDWDRIQGLLPGQVGQDNRLFMEAVVWVARTGAPWRDLPERFGNGNTTWRPRATTARRWSRRSSPEGRRR